MYSAVCWVPRGYSSQKPIQVVPTAEEIENYKKMLAEQDQLEGDFGGEEMGNEEMVESENIQGVLGDQIPSDVIDPTQDPNIMVGEDEWDSDGEDDLTILPTDNVLLAAKSDEDQSSLEVHVYDEENGNFYLHHDILLAAYPLCLAWMDCVPQLSDGANGHPVGSYVAVGTFHPEIEIWNTNVIDALEPDAVLGGAVGGKRRTLKPGSHRQAVMGLSWNKEYRNILASSSADTTVKLWDVTTQKCMMTLNHHKDKVPVVQFHPVEANIVLTSSYDHTCAVTDGRSPNNGTWIAIPARPEAAVWDSNAPYCFYVSTERGELIHYDVRNSTQPLYQQTIHQGPCTSISVNPAVPQLVATAGEDGFCRLWKAEEAQLVMVAERDMNLGNIFNCSFYNSVPYLLAACGTSKDLCLWDVREIDALAPLFNGNEANPVASEGLSFAASGNATGSLNDIQKRKH